MDTQCLNATQIARPLANFQPNIWGDRFVNYTPPDDVTRCRMEKEAKELKELIQKELLKDVKDTKQRIEYLDAIIKLGVAYHFQKEIEDNLQIFQKKNIDCEFDTSYEDDLHYVSLRFRLLRQHGFRVSCVANFQPDIWGDRFVNYTPLDQVTQYGMEKEAKELKDLIQKELLKDIEDAKQRIEYLDAIIRLGVAYHFENEIEDNLQIFQKKNIHFHTSYEDDLHYVSLHFRLLRQYGFHVSCDVLEKFTDEKGKFKDSLANDVEGIYNLYETSFVRIHGESILDEALAFSTKHLTSIVANSSSHPMVEQIVRSLELPLHKRSVRVESRHQITFYEAKSSHDQTLLKFAKLDFNMLLALHRMELAQYMRWSKNLDKAIKLPNFMRSRVVECYFWTLGAYHESKYAFARVCFGKIIWIISILDDIYDAYATTEELIIFTEAIQRWDKSFVKQLPEFMKLFYEAMIDTFDEMEQELAKEGRAYAAYYARQQLIATCEGYFQEAKWRFEKHVPTYEDYIKNGIFTAGYLLIFAASFVGMGDIANENAFKWLNKHSKAPKASCTITRLLDDIADHKFEQDREHVVSAVECYMKQYGASEEEAYEEIEFQIEEAWKYINEDMIGPTPISRPLLVRIINLTRLLYDFFKKGEDGYTTPKYSKPKIEAVLLNPFIL